MDVQTSPQLQVVGETIPKPIYYATQLVSSHTTQNLTKPKLKPIENVHGIPTIQFTMEKRADFAIEEGIHQAIVVQDAPEFNWRGLLHKYLGVKGKCLVGQIGRRQLLLRVDVYEDFVMSLSRAVIYLPYNGDDHQFRVFPWTLRFNPIEETSMAAVWISLPNLSPELLANKNGVVNSYCCWEAYCY